jgi:hypothetical protein
MLILARAVLKAVLAEAWYSRGTLHRSCEKMVAQLTPTRPARWSWSRAATGRCTRPSGARGRRQVKRRVGPAWLERGVDGKDWRPRRGRMPEGFLDEKRATVRMAELIAEHEERERATEAGERERREQGVTFRDLAAEWLDHLKRERGAKPSTLSDYRYMLAEPGTLHRRGKGKSPGPVMAAFGDLPAAKITTRQVSAFLHQLDESEVSLAPSTSTDSSSPRSSNYGRREDTHSLPTNPVESTSKRREPPPAVLDFYEPEEIEALAQAAADGGHRGPQPANLEPDEIAWRAREDAQDAELFRLASYTGLRLGELLALRREDIDLNTRA